MEGAQAANSSSRAVLRCGVRPSGCIRPKESETVQDEEILTSPGDVIFTRTPGAMEIRDGDVISCRIDGFETLSNPVVRRR